MPFAGEGKEGNSDNPRGNGSSLAIGATGVGNEAGNEAGENLRRTC